MFTIRKAARNALAVAVLTAGVGVVAPVSPAFATNTVDCSTAGDEFLKVWGHSELPSGTWYFEICLANAGDWPIDGWVDRISTGNNDIRYFDANGTTVDIRRWTDISFPNRPPNVDSIRIL